jgi:hypothetical protein
MTKKEKNSKRLIKFQINGHQAVKKFIDPTLCKVIRNYVEYKLKITGLEFNPNSFTLYRDILTESVLLNLLPKNLEKFREHEYEESYLIQTGYMSA